MYSTKWLNRIVGVFVVMSISQQLAQAQQISLQDCYQATAKNYPLIQKDSLLRIITQQTDAQLKKNYWPILQASAQATYQSEVTKIGLPGITPIDKDQYAMGISVSQPLFDGGETSAQRDLNQIQGKVQLQQNQVDLYAIKERVSNLFFQVLLLKESLKIDLATQKQLNARLEAKEGALKFGAAQEVDVNALKAEVLKAQQQITMIQNDQEAVLTQLSYFTGLTLKSEQQFSLADDLVIPASYLDKRPENLLFDLNKQTIIHQQKVKDTQLLPKISLFGMANYGRPGYNFLNNNFRDYGLVGAKITWNISSFYRHQAEKKINELQLRNVAVQQSVFELNQQAQFSVQHQNLKKLNELLSQDQEIIDLKIKVSKASEAKLDNGTETVSDYISDIQSEQQARLAKVLHQIQRYQTIEQLKLINGNQE